MRAARRSCSRSCCRACVGCAPSVTSSSSAAPWPWLGKWCWDWLARSRRQSRRRVPLSWSTAELDATQQSAALASSAAFFVLGEPFRSLLREVLHLASQMMGKGSTTMGQAGVDVSNRLVYRIRNLGREAERDALKVSGANINLLREARQAGVIHLPW